MKSEDERRNTITGVQTRKKKGRGRSRERRWSIER
jgi:hypothetical protein